MKRILLTTIMAFALILGVSGQCAYDNVFWTDLTPAAPGATATEFAGAGGDLYTVDVVAGQQYLFTTCAVGTFDTYLTLYQDDGITVIDFNDDDCGLQSSITWTATLTGTVHLLLDEFPCVNTGTGAQVDVTWLGAPPVGCVNGFAYPAPFAAPTNNIPYSIDACQWAGDYNTVTGVTAGSTFTSTGGGLGTYITVRSGTVGGPVVAEGFEPLNWTATVTADHFIHYNTDASCGTDVVCFESFLTCTSCPPAVFLPNDNCSDVVPTTLVNGVPVTFTGTTVGANGGPGDGIYPFITVWEAVTLTGVCNNLTLSYCGTTPAYADVWVNISTDCPATGAITADNWENTSCGNGNWVVTFNSLPAGTYYIPVLADPGFITQGPYSLEVLSEDCPPPPVNDDCIGAIPMGCGDVETGSTSFATPDLTAPDCSGGVGAGNGVWYSFVGNGLPFTISLCGSTYDTYLSLYSGPDCSTLTCEATNDDAPGGACGLQSEIQDFVTTPGTTYYVLINGFFGDAGDYTLTLSTPPASNDDCINATVILPGVTSGDTRCTNIDAVSAVGLATAPTAGGVWYSFTPGCSGDITASLCTGTTFNTQLSVFTGDCFALVGVDGNNDFCTNQSQVTWAGAAATTYYILVHGNGAEEGTFDLTLTQVDNIDPIPDVASLPDVSSECSVSLTAPTATDNCTGVIVGTTTDPTTYTVEGGPYVVTWTYDDLNGNVVTQTQNVFVLDDVTPPTIVCAADVVLDNTTDECGAYHDYTVSMSDNCTSNYFLTHSLDQSIMVGMSVACNAGGLHTDNSYFRVFDLTAFGVTGDLNVTSVDVGIEQAIGAIGSQPTEVRLYTLSGPFVLANLTLISNTPYTLNDMTPGIINIPVTGTIPAGSVMVVEFFTPNGQIDGNSIFVGSNNLGQTDDTYLAAATCGITEPLPTQTIGFPDMQWVLNVNGVAGSGGSSLTQTAGLPSGSLFPTGTTTNTFVADDGNGNTSTCSFTVTVNDVQAPTPDADSSAAFTYTSGPTSIPILDLATVTSTLVVSGAPTSLNSGDLSSVCIDITHTWDSDLDIVLISPLGTNYALSLGNGGLDDNYTGTCFDMTAVTPITGGTAPFTGSFIPEGPGGFDSFNTEDPNGTWTLSVTDNAGGDVGTINMFTMNFNFAYPTLLPTAFVECSAVAPTATDNCDGAVTATSLDPTSFTSDGTYTINWTYTDVAGNTSMQTQVIVADDITAPVADLANIDVTAECSITLTPPTATDACVGTVTGTTTDPTTYSALGTYTVIWTYDDGNGNTSTQTQTIIINDVTGPVPNVATLPDAVDECFATVTIFGTPTATDNCAGIIAGTTLDPLSYNVQGTYTVTWTYDDGNGNITTQTQTVIVDDNTAPLANNTNLPDVTGECTATLVAPSATDNCAGPLTGTTSDPTSYSVQGTYTVTWTYDDGNGNTTTQTQTVIVDDVTAPVADVAVLADVNGECSTVITLTPPTATDICAGAITGTTSSPTTYSSVGIYTITWTYDDGNGNTSTQTQNVVIGDNTAPVADLANIDVTLDCGETVVAPTATDNCTAGAITGTTSDPITFTGAGPFTVTWTYDDGNGNTSTQTQTVTISDGTAPVADVASIDVSGDCSVTVTAPTATDNCAGSITGTTADPLTYTGVGTYTVTWSYDDGNGNTSTQTQTVTIFDATAPVPDDAILPTVTGECTATVSTVPTATDGCEGAITGTTVDVLTYNSAGTYTVEWTFDDGNGNVSTQTQTVVVTDNTAPAPSAALLPNVVGNCVVTVATIPTAVDNCEGTITGTTTDPLTYNAVGTYFIIWTFDDGNGNIFTQNQTVIVDPCLGVEDESGEWNALVYPNPGNGIFTLSLAEMPTEKTEIRLVNALGQVIYNGVLQAQVQQFDFTHLASATYYLMITNSQGQITKPVIIKHND